MFDFTWGKRERERHPEHFSIIRPSYLHIYVTLLFQTWADEHSFQVGK